ncbi:MAG: copper homeostasis protein CutC, partial [Pedobacter sp.]
MANYTLEICAGTLNSALIAQANGADRVELCDNLAEGGTTPSAGMISQCKKLLHIPFFPIIRPRGGDFVYSRAEFEVMKDDVIFCRKLNCEGVVIGMLREDGNVDVERCSELISLAGSMQITFHRAFDRCKSMEKSLEDIVGLGCHRILTSGGKVHAIDARNKLKSLVEQAGSRI